MMIINIIIRIFVNYVNCQEMCLWEVVYAYCRIRDIFWQRSVKYDSTQRYIGSSCWTIVLYALYRYSHRAHILKMH